MVTQADEYNSLRQEMFLHQSRRDQTFIFTITAITAIFGFSVQLNNQLLPFLALPLAFLGSILLAFIDLIVTRIGEHIRTEIETRNDELLWETKSFVIKEQIKASSIKIMHITLCTTGILSLVLATILAVSKNDPNTIAACPIVGIVWLAGWLPYSIGITRLEKKVHEEWGTKWTLGRIEEAKKSVPTIKDVKK